jgi:hypothetical protein
MFPLRAIADSMVALAWTSLTRRHFSVTTEWRGPSVLLFETFD